MCMNRSKKLGHFLAVLLVVVSLAGCSLNQEASPPTPTARVSFYHACPDGPDMYVLIADATVTTQQFSFASFTGYLYTKAESKSVKFKSASDLSVLVDTTFTFTDKLTYSIFAVNSVAKLRALRIPDVGALQSQANTMVRFIHLSPDAQAVTATMVGSSGPLFSGGYQDYSDFTEMAATVYTLEIRAQNDNHLILTTSVPTTAGAYYTIALTGYATPPPNNTHTLSAKIIAN